MSGAASEARPWGTLPGGQAVQLHTLRAGGLELRVSEFGGVIVNLLAPDRHGQPGDVVLGHDALAGYLGHEQSPYFGALIGRCANRVARGRFRLDGHEYTLAVNNGPNALHGGLAGFDQVLWAARPLDTGAGPALELSYTSPDGEEGYPGTLAVQVRYTLTHAGELEIVYHAETDRPTVVNLTNHSYWNLSAARRDVLDHQLQLHAGAYTPVDGALIPTGELAGVAGTPFDFRTPHRLGERLGAADPQLAYAGGYDHNFVLDERSGGQPAAVLSDDESGRVLSVYTDQPGLQLYSGNFLDGSIRGKGGQPYPRHWAVCLETQHFPDSPNQPQFPSVRLDPGQPFSSRTRYQFSVR